MKAETETESKLVKDEEGVPSFFYISHVYYELTHYELTQFRQHI